MHSLLLTLYLAVYPTPHQQRQLAPGIDQETVVYVLGEPDGTALSTCGSNTYGGEWRCLVWQYDAPGRRFKVFFYKNADGIWLVNSWGG